jgi:hypothetical protein
MDDPIPTLGSYMAPTQFLAPMAASEVGPLETLEITKGSKIISFIIKQTEQDQYKGWLPNSTMRNAGKDLQWGTESMTDTVIVHHVYYHHHA